MFKLNKKMLILAIVPFVMLTTGALAGDLGYTYVQGAWTNVDPEQGDSGNGPALGVSWAVTDMVHVVGGYDDVDFDPGDFTQMKLGVGMHPAITDNIDFVGEIAYVDADLGPISESGYSLCAGMRTQLTDMFELKAGLSHKDVDNVIDDTTLDVDALFNVKDNLAISTGFELGDNTTYFAGIRFYFGKH